MIAGDGTIKDFRVTRGYQPAIAPPQEMIGKKIEDVYPLNVWEKYQQVIDLVETYNHAISSDFDFNVDGVAKKYTVRVIPTHEDDEFIAVVFLKKSS